jgi:hypothetical protein
VKDDRLDDILPPELLERYEVHSYRNAARILASACKQEFVELVETLAAFRIEMDEMVRKGGNKSQIAKNMDDLLNPKGWFETRIHGDLEFETVSKRFVGMTGGKKPKKKWEPDHKRYRIENIIDGHKIDFIKGKVAFDMEWNSKDQTFDRDLYAMRAFYEAGIISAGVLLTRDSSLRRTFSDIGQRVDIDKFASKYGASTTWMGKLTYRLDAGRAGGCPILAIGITPRVISDFDEWVAAHPVIREKVDLGELDKPVAEEGDE